MRLFRSKEERAARQAETERLDREHAERFAAASAKAHKGPTRCPSCHAWLPSTATRCDYCESVTPPRREPGAEPVNEAVTATTTGDAESEAAFGSEVDRFLRGIPGG